MRRNLLSISVCALMTALAGQVYAVKNFADNSTAYMRQILDDAKLASDCYNNNATVRAGYRPSDNFLNSPEIGYKYKLSDGRTVFTFDRIGEAMSSDDQLLYSYVYNPANGMITPYEDDVTKATVSNAKPPNFAAQVLEKDGQTYIAFRGSEVKWDDWGNTNIPQLAGYVPAQFKIADMLVQAVQSTTSGPVRLTGHSEGAGEVQYALLRSLQRGNENISGSAFNYQQLSKEVLALFSEEEREMAGALLGYFRVGNDVVSGASILGEGALSEEEELGEACWINIGDGYLCFRPLKAHFISTVIELIEEAIARKEAEAGAGGPGGGTVTDDDLDSLGDGDSGGRGGSGAKGINAHRWGQSN